MTKKLKLISLLLSVAALGLSAAACGKKGGAKTLVMLSKGVHPYYTPCFAGFKDSAEKLGYKAEYVAPKAFELPLQVKALEDLVARQVAGIALSALDDDGLKPVVHEATKAGIKLLTFDAPAPSTEALSYIGTANEAAGKACGEALVKLLKGKGEVAVLQGGLAAPNLNQRYQGLMAALKAAPGIKVVAREDTEGKLEKTVNVAESLLQAHPKLAAFVAVSGEGAPGAAAVVKERKLTAKVQVAGFDDLPETLDYIREGTVAYCVAQKTYLMGWRSAQRLHEALQGKEIPKLEDTGVAMVTKANVDSYQEEMKKEVAALSAAQ